MHSKRRGGTEVGAFLSRLLAGVAMMFLGFSALGKFTSADVVARWASQVLAVPTIVSLPLVLLTAAVELALLVTWFSVRPRYYVARCSAGLIGGFSLVLLWAWLVMDVRQCACLGKLSEWHGLLGSVEWSLVRNAGLLVALLPASFGAAEDRLSSSERHPGWPGWRTGVSVSGVGRGFTLIEILVGIAIVAVLIGLLIPALSSMMAVRRKTVAVSQLRSSAQALAAYALSHRDLPPVKALPGADHEMDDRAFEPVPTAASYFDVSSTWWALVFGPDPASRARSPFARVARDVKTLHALEAGTHHHMSCALLATPDFWDQYHRTGPRQWIPQTLSSIKNPSKKGLVIDLAWWSVREEPSLGVAAADASVFVAERAKFIRGYHKGDGRWWKAGSVHFSSMAPGMHTIRGVEGTDW